MTQAYFHASDCDLDDFKDLIARSTDPATVPHAADVTRNVPIYDCAKLPLVGTGRTALMAEWAQVFLTGPGVLVLRGAYADCAPIDAATAVYNNLIAQEKEAGTAQADHFSKGTNDRLWNSLQKLCLAAPATFAAYFGNTAIQTVSEAWLGPNYQMSAQVNLVRPGGAAQKVHRDYHLGFQTAEIAALYPAHVHDLSPVLTLQGAIAHCDMPLESGPTKLLPFSQAYRPGYAAWRLPDFAAVFEDQCLQLPLRKGDALFFNPALFHAAGANTSADIQRMANLLQVSSAFGRALEAFDRVAMCKALYPAILDENLSQDRVGAAIAACAEGYSFPTNLDRDPPIGGLAPETQAALFHRALADPMTPEAFGAALDAQADRKRP